MQLNKTGIPVNVSPKMKPLSIQAQKESKRKHVTGISDYDRYSEIATLRGVEWGCVVYTMVPTGHPDYQKALKRGMKVEEIWSKQT